METAKIFETGRKSKLCGCQRSSASRLMKVVVQQLGDAVLLVPKESLWQTFLDGLNGFTDDALKMDEIRERRRNVNLYDVYAGYQYLHLCDEKEAREGPAALPEGTG